jgi:hypothetical protein
MSVFTNVAFINQDLSVVKKFFSRKSEPGYLYQIKENWTALFLNEEDENKATILMDLSKKSSCYIIQFLCSEDVGWYYSLYLNGTQIESLEVNYDIQNKVPDSTPFLSLQELSFFKNEALFKKIKSLINGSEEDSLFESGELFLQTLCFNSVYGLSFTDLEQYSPEQLKIKEFIPIKKKKGFYDLVVETVGQCYLEQGFTVECLHDDKHVAFTKLINNYNYTIYFDISSRNRLLVNIHMPFIDNEYDSYLNKQKLIQGFSYKNNKELKNILLLFEKEYLDRVLLEFIQNKVVIKDESLLPKTIDTYFQLKGYKKLVDEDRLKAKWISYNSNQAKFSFYLPKGRTYFGIKLYFNDKQYYYTELQKIFDQKEIKLTYRNDFELKEVLENLIVFLDIVLENLDLIEIA